MLRVAFHARYTFGNGVEVRDVTINECPDCGEDIITEAEYKRVLAQAPPPAQAG